MKAGDKILTNDGRAGVVDRFEGDSAVVTIYTPGRGWGEVWLDTDAVIPVLLGGDPQDSPEDP